MPPARLNVVVPPLQITKGTAVVTPVLGPVTVIVTGVDVADWLLLVHVTMQWNCVVWVIVPLDMAGFVCTEPSANQLVPPSVEYSHWYCSPEPKVYPVKLRFALPSQANVVAVDVDVPATGMPLQAGGSQLDQ